MRFRQNYYKILQSKSEISIVINVAIKIARVVKYMTTIRSVIKDKFRKMQRDSQEVHRVLERFAGVGDRLELASISTGWLGIA